MKHWMMGAAAASAVALLGMPAIAGDAPPYYQEQHEPNDSFATAESIGGLPGSFLGIQGNIGEDGDTIDVYKFHWAGGVLAIGLGVGSQTVPVDLCAPETNNCFTAKVFDQNLSLLFTVFNDDFLDGAPVAAGDYYLQIASPGIDPPFTAAVFTLDGRDVVPAVITAPTAVPEPASLAVLGLGLAGLAGLRRRR